MPAAPSQQQSEDLLALARAINGDWPRVAEVWETFRTQHGLYLRAELSANGEDFLQQALWAALGKGVLRALLKRLVEAGLAGADIHDAARPFIANGFQMQSYVNGQWKPQDALLNGRRLFEACDHVCRISIDGQHKGTGILIRPTLVATAAHVVTELVEPTSGKALDGSVGRLQVHFFHADDLLPDGQEVPARPVAATLRQDWLGHYSPPGNGEGGPLQDIDTIVGLAPDTGPWDLALIRLSQPPRTGLRGHRLFDGHPPEVTFGIHVLHHPGAAVGGRAVSMLWSIGTVSQALGAPGLLRWLHDANTARGSSGAPCFDDSWNVVALHQGGSVAPIEDNQTNRAVPIYRWASQVDTIASNRDVTPYLSFVVDENRRNTPVFGRRGLQQRAWRAMTASSPLRARERLFLVLGEPGSGKSFTAAILAALGAQCGCPLASLDVRNSANATAVAFAQQVLGSVGAARIGEAPLGGLTTEWRDVRNETVPQLGDALQTLAAGRPLWLVLDGLEICDTAAPGVAQVVDGLVAALPRLQHVHLVLVGWKGAVETEHAEALSVTPTVEEIVDHLLLTVAPPGYEPDAPLRTVLTQIVQGRLNAQPVGDRPYARAAAAAEQARNVVQGMLRDLAGLPAAPEAPVVEGASG